MNVATESRTVSGAENDRKKEDFLGDNDSDSEDEKLVSRKSTDNNEENSNSSESELEKEDDLSEENFDNDDKRGQHRDGSHPDQVKEKLLVSPGKASAVGVTSVPAATSDGTFLRSNFKPASRRGSTGTGLWQLPTATSSTPSWMNKLKNKEHQPKIQEDDNDKAQKEEEPKDDGVPEWKKKLLKKKGVQPTEAEMDPSLPAWKRSLIKKKRHEAETARKEDEDVPDAMDNDDESKPAWMKKRLRKAGQKEQKQQEATKGEEPEEESKPFHGIGPDGHPLMPWQMKRLRRRDELTKVESTEEDEVLATEGDPAEFGDDEAEKSDTGRPEFLKKFKTMGFKKEEKVIEVSGKQDPTVVRNKNGITVCATSRSDRYNTKGTGHENQSNNEMQQSHDSISELGGNHGKSVSHKSDLENRTIDHMEKANTQDSSDDSSAARHNGATQPKKSSYLDGSTDDDSDDTSIDRRKVREKPAIAVKGASHANTSDEESDDSSLVKVQVKSTKSSNEVTSTPPKRSSFLDSSDDDSDDSSVMKVRAKPPPSHASKGAPKKSSYLDSSDDDSDSSSEFRKPSQSPKKQKKSSVQDSSDEESDTPTGTMKIRPNKPVSPRKSPMPKDDLSDYDSDSDEDNNTGAIATPYNGKIGNKKGIPPADFSDFSCGDTTDDDTIAEAERYLVEMSARRAAAAQRPAPPPTKEAAKAYATKTESEEKKKTKKIEEKKKSKGKKSKTSPKKSEEKDKKASACKEKKAHINEKKSETAKQSDAMKSNKSSTEGKAKAEKKKKSSDRTDKKIKSDKAEKKTKEKKKTKGEKTSKKKKK